MTALRFRNKLSRWGGWGVLAAVLLSACSEATPTPLPSPLVVSRPQAIAPQAYAAIKTQFGLGEAQAVQAVDSGLGALEPALPMAYVDIYQCQDGGNAMVVSNSPLSGQKTCRYYIAETAAGEYALLKTQADLQRVFGPVDSGPEAASYVAASTPSLTVTPRTQAKRTDQGYELSFYREVCLQTNQVRMQVTVAGDVSHLNTIADPDTPAPNPPPACE